MTTIPLPPGTLVPVAHHRRASTGETSIDEREHQAVALIADGEGSTYAITAGGRRVLLDEDRGSVLTTSMIIAPPPGSITPDLWMRPDGSIALDWIPVIGIRVESWGYATLLYIGADGEIITASELVTPDMPVGARWSAVSRAAADKGMAALVAHLDASCDYSEGITVFPAPPAQVDQ